MIKVRHYMRTRIFWILLSHFKFVHYVKVVLTTVLHDFMKFRRFKVQPSKFGKSLEKALRKSRMNTCKNIVKKHKNFLKAIISHQRYVNLND